MPYLSALEQKLLLIGGEALVLRNETREDTALIVKEGKLFPVRYRRVQQGESNGCHANSARLYLAGRQIATGYGLKEGLWRQRSWGVEDYVTESGKVVERIVETTVKFRLYFGLVRSDRKAFRFGIENLGVGPEELGRREQEFLRGKFEAYEDEL